VAFLFSDKNHHSSTSTRIRLQTAEIWYLLLAYICKWHAVGRWRKIWATYRIIRNEGISSNF